MALPDDPTPGPRRTWRRVVLVALVAAIPVVPIVIGTELSAGSTTTAPTATVTAPVFSQAPTATSPPKPASTPGGALVALLTRATTLRKAPSGAPIGRLNLKTDFGSPQALLVMAQRPGWLGVLSPLAGNGRIGWVPRSTVTLGRVDWKIDVSLARREITVIEGGRTLERYRAAIGTGLAPTPAGHFEVTDRLLTGDAGGPYGCCILALSAHAPHAIQGWSGGDRIAIHATPELASIGQAASHGCLRVSPADGRWLLEHIPLGTPVLIRE